MFAGQQASAATTQLRDGLLLNSYDVSLDVAISVRIDGLKPLVTTLGEPSTAWRQARSRARWR